MISHNDGNKCTIACWSWKHENQNYKKHFFFFQLVTIVAKH